MKLEGEAVAMTTDIAVVEATGVSIVFGSDGMQTTALANVNLSIERGEFVSLIGPSGCGKTTLLRAVADLERPTSGTLTVNGMSPEAARRRRAYGYVFQAPALYAWRTVERNVMLPLEIMGLPAGERRERAQRYLDAFNGVKSKQAQLAVKNIEIKRLLEITRGRAFVLFTSYVQMRDVYHRLLGELDYPLLLQGDAPKSALLEEFRITPNAVLFATSSFWQGVDVQGDQLSCVIIDRLPFAVPSDPVVAARVKSIDAEGGNAFFDYQIPAAVITLKQGFGRLIRSLHDRGLLVLLDNRILKKAYGKVFLESLPNYRKTTAIEQVEEFFSLT